MGSAAIFLVLIVFAVIWIGLQYLQDPVDIIDRPVGRIIFSQDSTILNDYLPEERLYRITTLTTSKEKQIRFTVSTPIKIPEDGLPVVFILGGLDVGTYTLGYIQNPGNNILIVYNYPYHPEYWYAGTAVEEILIIRESVLEVPAQVLVLYQWVANQPWSDETRMTITGYSFGALFLPAVYHLAVKHQIQIKYGVLAYGGVDIYQLLTTNMINVHQPFRSMISWLAFTAIRGIEPGYHAPHMKGEFYLINGYQDHQIPESSWRELHRLVPEPKKILVLNEGHMHQRKVELTKRLVNLSQKWLLERNVINP